MAEVVTTIQQPPEFIESESKLYLDQLQKAIGGLKSDVPTEGITFVFKGKLYKYTGAFAPANQILGMLKFV